MTPPVSPEKDIGPIYKAFAGLLVAFACGIITVQVLRGERIGFHDILFLSISVMFCILLWRPDKFDGLVKTIADHLPFFKYQKDG